MSPRLWVLHVWRNTKYWTIHIGTLSKPRILRFSPVRSEFEYICCDETTDDVVRRHNVLSDESAEGNTQVSGGGGEQQRAERDESVEKEGERRKKLFNSLADERERKKSLTENFWVCRENFTVCILRSFLPYHSSSSSMSEIGNVIWRDKKETSVDSKKWRTNDEKGSYSTERDDVQSELLQQPRGAPEERRKNFIERREDKFFFSSETEQVEQSNMCSLHTPWSYFTFQFGATTI